VIAASAELHHLITSPSLSSQRAVACSDVDQRRVLNLPNLLAELKGSAIGEHDVRAMPRTRR
jgi:hypothetical protein